jgi:hypothetical protein
MPTELTQHLLAGGLLTQEKAGAALGLKAAAGGALDTALLEQGGISELQILRALGEVSGYPPVNLAEFDFNREVAALIPPKIADQYGIVPLSLQGNTLHVACTYPVPKRALQEVSFLLNKRLELWVGLEVRIRDWIRSLYGLPISERLTSLLAALERAASQAAPSDRGPRELPMPDQPLTPDLVERLARSIVDEPIAAKASHPGARRKRNRHPLSRPRAAQATPEWTLAQAREMLKEAAKDREGIIDVALRFARRTFDFAAAFAVLRGTAIEWDTRGDGRETVHADRIYIPLDAASVFRTAAVTRKSYLGPVPADAFSHAFLKQLGRAPRAIFLFPVEVSSRLIAIFYGDCSQRPVSQRRLSDFVLFCQDLPAAFQELIIFRRQRAPAAAASAGRHRAPEGPPESIPAVVWTPEPQLPARARTAARPKRSPHDFDVLLRRLTSPDPEQRSQAVEELSRSPEESAHKLATHFPGPSGWSRLPVVEPPGADELGPIPAALCALGQPGARALAPLLDSANSDTRYFALLAAGSLPYPEVVDGVLRGLFDLQPEISSAARAAATALRGLPRFESSIQSIRQELASKDSLRRSLAARALGALHDRESIDGLIGLTSSEDQLCAQAAAEALREITRASFGTNSRQWTSWWAENRDRRRPEWLVVALRHKDFDLRLCAIQELAQAFDDNLGYFADAPPMERLAAVKRWEALIRRGRKHKLSG